MHELKDWVNASDANKLHFRRQLDNWNAVHQDSSSLFDRNKAFRRFKNRVNKAAELMNEEVPVHESLLSNENKSPNRNRRRLYYKIASYAAILCLIVGVLYFLQNDRINLTPSSNQAQITYIHVEVPAGAREKYILPDQSVVWLNAGSTFKYPATFNGQTREVFLNGEGYFQVAKDANHPFIVNTAKGNITVTGTTFNVYSYDAKPRFVTALLEGHVRVNVPEGQTVNLLPAQKAEWVNESLNVSPVTDPDIYRWMEGLICFENEEITAVLENLENSFGQQITIQHLSNPNLLLTGKFRISDGLEYALKILSESYGITYKTDGNGYIILN